MPRTCTICVHPERPDIDAALVAGASYRDIACQFDVGRMAVQRHAREHIAATLAKAQAAEEIARADTLLNQVKSLQAKALALLDAAEKSGDLRTALAAVREARGNLELLAKLQGELDERPQVNIVLTPQWIQTRTIIVAALAPFPDARLAVAAALARVEGTAAHGG